MSKLASLVEAVLRAFAQTDSRIEMVEAIEHDGEEAVWIVKVKV